MLLVVILTLVFASAALIAYIIIPSATGLYVSAQRKRSESLVDDMDRIFVRVKPTKVILLFSLGPPLLGLAGFHFFPAFRLIGVVAGVVLGFIGPSIYVKMLAEQRKERFQNQLVDSLMIMSSSLKGGLSIIQAMEVVNEEMPPPISQEFGILLGENKMGVSLEESFSRLYERVPSNALHQLITAILLARETGGNLPVIFNRIVTTIRENNKIKENLRNLTLQGKLQGIIMSALPIGFLMIVLSTNKHFFDVMLETQQGKNLLVLASCLQLIGMFLIYKISKFKDF